MPKQPLIVGNPVFVVVDMQESGGHARRRGGHSRTCPATTTGSRVAQRLLAAARAAGIPVVFFQEVHRPSGIDFGRELDGVEGVHCVEGRRGTDLHPALRPTEPRRVSPRQAALLRLHRHRIRHRAARSEGRHADPRRRTDRRLRALHLRRRPPARLLRAGGDRLRRGFVAVPPRRGAGRDGVPADRCAAHHRGDPRRIRRLAAPPPSSKEPPDDQQDSAPRRPSPRSPSSR